MHQQNHSKTLANQYVPMITYHWSIRNGRPLTNIRHNLLHVKHQTRDVQKYRIFFWDDYGFRAAPFLATLMVSFLWRAVWRWYHVQWKRMGTSEYHWRTFKINENQNCTNKTKWKHMRINTYRWAHATEPLKLDAHWRILGTRCFASSAKRLMNKIIKYFCLMNMAAVPPHPCPPPE